MNWINPPWFRGSSEGTTHATRIPGNGRDAGGGPQPAHGHAVHGLVHHRVDSGTETAVQRASLAGSGRDDCNAVVLHQLLPFSSIGRPGVRGEGRIRRLGLSVP